MRAISYNLRILCALITFSIFWAANSFAADGVESQQGEGMAQTAQRRDTQDPMSGKGGTSDSAITSPSDSHIGSPSRGGITNPPAEEGKPGGTVY